MERQLRGIDILALIFATLCLLEAALGLALQPGYRTMFAEFGGELPRWTELMLQPATLVVAGLAPMMLVAEGVLRRRSEQAQFTRCVVALIAAVGLVVGFLAAMYLPLFHIGGAIK